MELTSKQQAVDLIKRTNKILVVSHGEDGDSLGTVLALKGALQKLGKEVSTVVNSPPPSQFSFLPDIDKLSDSKSLNRDFIISLSCQDIELEKLGYRIEGDKLNIYVTPKVSDWSKEKVQFLEINPNFEAIIVLDTPNLSLLGQLYEKNTNFFYNSPVINIDHHSNNKYFGKINWVEVGATSTSEIAVSLVESLGSASSLLDEKIATALLVGILTDTNFFQHPRTTSKSLTIAAQLIAAGAKREEIVSQLSAASKLSQIRLLGKIMAALREDSENKIAWAPVWQREQEEVGVSPGQILMLLEKTTQHIPEADILVVFWEQEEGTKVIVKPFKKYQIEEIGSLFRTVVTHLGWLEFDLEDSLPDAEKKILNKLKSFVSSKTT